MLLFSFFTSVTFAQDTVIKLNNDMVFAKIFELNKNEVIYKKYLNQTGPTYTDKITDIKMVAYYKRPKEILRPDTSKTKSIIIDNKIADGRTFYYYHNRPIKERGMHKVLLSTNDQKIKHFVRKAKVAKGTEFIGFATIPLASAAFVFGFLTIDPEARPTAYISNQGYFITALTLAATTITCPILSIVSKNKKKNRNSEALKLYNEKF